MTTIKDAYQFGIEPVRITDTDNIQVNEGNRDIWSLDVASILAAR